MNPIINRTLQDYQNIVGPAVLGQLAQLAEHLNGKKVVHVNSTRAGGGVAEILSWMIPFMRELGIDASWEVIGGNEPFFNVTKMFHNGLQGNRVPIKQKHFEDYIETSKQNAADMCPLLEDADFVIIHDPQPAMLLSECKNRRGKWIWRCHIDASKPYRKVWKFLQPFVKDYDASIFSMAAFSQSLPHPQFLVAPSIDPLSDKNVELPQSEIDMIFDRFDLERDIPIMCQVSRFDRFKDPLGVIMAYKHVKKFSPVQLILAGGAADDDPEGAEVLTEVQAAAADDPDIHILLLPPDAHRTINALQRASTLILQKSTREGFGLTVTEGLWKGRPVIGGNVGGIRLQVINHHTGFLVSTPEGVAQRVRYLLNHPDIIKVMGNKGREFVRENFLLTRHLREYLTLMVGLQQGFADRLMVAA